jgi:hypothetical protein
VRYEDAVLHVLKSTLMRRNAVLMKWKIQ